MIPNHQGYETSNDHSWNQTHIPRLTRNLTRSAIHAERKLNSGPFEPNVGPPKNDGSRNSEPKNQQLEDHKDGYSKTTIHHRQTIEHNKNEEDNSRKTNSGENSTFLPPSPLETLE
mmetsp:Transcript_23026/g.27247  ORF Transcript_23026/g.27247 Transcript_23026/m.27247 type:complete len:116 (-) Transcript_23026:103-450(-)